MPTAQKDVAIEHSLLERISDARRRSDALFDIIRTDAMYDRPIPERHRIIFYVGHLEAFDWNLLHENVFGLKSFHPEFDRLFAFGIDPVRWRIAVLTNPLTGLRSKWYGTMYVRSESLSTRNYPRQVLKSVNICGMVSRSKHCSTLPSSTG